MSVQSVRGAIQISADLPEFVDKGVIRMIDKILSENSISGNDLVNIQFTITGDLKSRNPATALRKGGYSEIPLFCSLEPDCEGMLPMMIRTLITFNTENKKKMVPVYLDGAEKLRPDLFG